MDFVSIGLSAVLSALLFVLLEFSVILPLFKKIVSKAVADEVSNHLVPTISQYIDSKIASLTTDLTKSLFVKIRGMFGGNKKGVNAIINRLADGEDLEDLEDEYEPSTMEKAIDILYGASQYLQRPSGVVNNGEKEEIVHKDEDQNSLQNSPTQAFKKIERIE